MTKKYRIWNKYYNISIYVNPGVSSIVNEMNRLSWIRYYVMKKKGDTKAVKKCRANEGCRREKEEDCKTDGWMT